jgi:hypothetical protein
MVLTGCPCVREGGRLVLVFDLGGGTFDVSLLNIDAGIDIGMGIFEVKIISEGRTLKALRFQISSPGISWGIIIDVFNFSSDRCQTLSPVPHRGAVIDVFNFGGDRSQTLPPAPPGAPPSTPSTLVVAARACCQHPPGGRHRRLQLRW